MRRSERPRARGRRWSAAVGPEPPIATRVAPTGNVEARGRPVGATQVAIATVPSARRPVRARIATRVAPTGNVEARGRPVGATQVAIATVPSARRPVRARIATRVAPTGNVEARGRPVGGGASRDCHGSVGTALGSRRDRDSRCSYRKRRSARSPRRSDTSRDCHGSVGTAPSSRPDRDSRRSCGKREAQVPYLRARVSCSATNSCDSLCLGSRWIIGLACSCDSLILIEADR